MHELVRYVDDCLALTLRHTMGANARMGSCQSPCRDRGQSVWIRVNYMCGPTRPPKQRAHVPDFSSSNMAVVCPISGCLRPMSPTFKAGFTPSSPLSSFRSGHTAQVDDPGFLCARGLFSETHTRIEQSLPGCRLLSIVYACRWS